MKIHHPPLALLLGTLTLLMACEGISESKSIDPFASYEGSKTPGKWTPGSSQPGDPNSPPGTWTPGDPKNPASKVVPVAPGEVTMKRLTQRQYTQAVEDLLGQGPMDLTLEGDTNPGFYYSIGAARTTLSELGTQLYLDSASQIVRQAQATGSAPWGACNDAGCAKQWVASFGRKAFRRPMAQDEIDTWVGLAQANGDGHVAGGLEFVLAGMLQHPEFLYQIEAGEPDPAFPNDATKRRYTSQEMASRLSFLLWNSVPDDALLDAAERGDLVKDDLLAQHVMRMIEDPRAVTAVQDFFTQYLDLNRLGKTSRDNTPGFDPALLGAMNQEVLLFVYDVVFQRDEDIRTLFSAPRAYVNKGLADHYGIADSGATAGTFVPVELPAESGRAGVLGLGAFLTMNSHEARTSPTARGKFIRERIYCMTVPAAPPDVVTELDDPAEGTAPMTVRERIAKHSEDSACAGCHAFLDPPGLVFENFGPVGEYRTESEGATVDTKVEIGDKTFRDAADFAAYLGQSDTVADCIVDQLYAHAQGRTKILKGSPQTDWTTWEYAQLEEIKDTMKMTGYRFKDALMLIATSQAFRTMTPENGGTP